MSGCGSVLKWDFRAWFSECLSTKSREECWEWPGVLSNGYGLAWDGTDQVLVHRWASEEIFGPIPDGLHVCHECDNRKCGNPWHGFRGTNEDNHKDKVAKHRQLRKLTVEQVCAISIDQRRYVDIATEYGISITVVHEIKHGKKYKYILAEHGIKPYIPPQEQKHPPQKLTEDQARAIYYDKRTVRVIAAEYGVSSPTVVGIKNGDYWQHIHQEAMSRGDANVKKGPGKGLDPATLLAIYEAKGSQTAIAKQYGITQATVSRIKARHGMYATLIDAALASRKDAA